MSYLPDHYNEQPKPFQMQDTITAKFSTGDEILEEKLFLTWDEYVQDDEHIYDVCIETPFNRFDGWMEDLTQSIEEFTGKKIHGDISFLS